MRVKVILRKGNPETLDEPFSDIEDIKIEATEWSLNSSFSENKRALSKETLSGVEHCKELCYSTITIN